MTELDEIVLVSKLAWALRECKDLTDVSSRTWFYLSRTGVDLRDFIPGLRERLDRKAVSSEIVRRRITKDDYQKILDERYAELKECDL